MTLPGIHPLNRANATCVHGPVNVRKGGFFFSINLQIAAASFDGGHPFVSASSMIFKVRLKRSP